VDCRLRIEGLPSADGPAELACRLRIEVQNLQTGGGETVGWFEVDSLHVDLQRGVWMNLLHLPDLKQTPPSERSTRTGAAVRRSQPVRPERAVRSGGYNGAPQIAVRAYYTLTLAFCQIRREHLCYSRLAPQIGGRAAVFRPVVQVANLHYYFGAPCSGGYRCRAGELPTMRPPPAAGDGV
jgi:hypothetical protein